MFPRPCLRLVTRLRSRCRRRRRRRRRRANFLYMQRDTRHIYPTSVGDARCNARPNVILTFRLVNAPSVFSRRSRQIHSDAPIGKC